MLFTQKLNDGVYPPWEQNYIAYDLLKKQLKETSESDWSEDDEVRFVQLLDKELDKVYGFETAKYEEISEQLSKIEQRVNGLDVAAVQTKDLEPALESILGDATHLDRFRRLNYTGFLKVVRKHDRLHSQYQVMPLLHARFRSVPFHSEDYSPLLRRLGHIYAKIDEIHGGGARSAGRNKLGSVDKDNRSSGYVTLQFWVHADNLMEVKTRILRRLPVLVYNREDDDEDRERDPIVTSLYLDNRKFELYQSLLERTTSDDNEVGNSLRFRWYGKLYDRPEIVLERHNEFSGDITRANFKEKMINKFLEGDKSVTEKQVRKMKDRHVQQRAIDDYESAASELQKFVTTNKLEPMLRTVYRRTAFEIPGDDRVRVILDQDIVFMREDSLSTNRPIRDPSNWHRADLDRPDVDPMTLLRKGEFARFPYSVLEVRLRAGDHHGLRKLPWIEELEKSGLVKEVSHFTKFLQGVAVLFGDDERLDALPFWLSEIDPKNIENQDLAAQQQQQQQPAQPAAGPSAPKVQQYKFDYADDEFDSEDSGMLDPVEEEEAEEGPTNIVGLPTRVGKLPDEESEDDEVILPPGVEQPNEWIKNQSAPKVEAKVWLANERTFNKWLHITCLMSALTFTLYSSVGRAASSTTATSVAYILFGLTLFCGIWGYSQYILRIRYIKERGDRPMDAPFGPIVVSIVLLLALIINFSALYSSADAPDQEVLYSF